MSDLVPALMEDCTEARLLASIRLYGEPAGYRDAYWDSFSKDFRNLRRLVRNWEPGWEWIDLEREVNSRLARVKPESVDGALHLLNTAARVPAADSQMFREEFILQKAHQMVQAYLAGEEVSPEALMVQALDSLPVIEQQGGDKSLTDILKEAVPEASPDIWGLEGIGDYLRPPSRGMFVTLAARFGQGKTSTTMSLLMGMLKNKTGSLKKALWLVNEDSPQEIKLRSYQTATGLALTEIAALGAEEVQRRYDEALGDASLVVKGIHGTHWPQIQRIIAKEAPDVVVFDMIDHMVDEGVDRQDLQLEALYLKVRGHAATQGYLAIGTSQLSLPPPGARNDTRRPSIDYMKGSRTSKQASAQDIWVLGHDEKHPEYRWLSFPKTKIALEGYSPLTTICYKFDRLTGLLTPSPEPIDPEQSVMVGSGLVDASLMEEWS